MTSLSIEGLTRGFYDPSEGLASTMLASRCRRDIAMISARCQPNGANLSSLLKRLTGSFFEKIPRIILDGEGGRGTVGERLTPLEFGSFLASFLARSILYLDRPRLKHEMEGNGTNRSPLRHPRRVGVLPDGRAVLRTSPRFLFSAGETSKAGEGEKDKGGEEASISPSNPLTTRSQKYSHRGVNLSKYDEIAVVEELSLDTSTDLGCLKFDRKAGRR